MIGELAQVLLLLVSVGAFFRYAQKTKDNLYLIFLALFFATMLLSELYYFTHTYLREGIRVPFAANDIADFGAFLLIGTALSSALGKPRRGLAGVTAAALAFAAANVALWIGWSGEWLRDILGGLSWGWFLCVCFRSLAQTEAGSRGERIALWALCALLIAVQTATFFVPEKLRVPLDRAATALMSAAAAWFLVRILLALRRGRSPEKALSLSFTGYLWTTVCLYMSEGLPYDIFANLVTLQLLLILLAVRKKVRAA